MPKKMLKLFLPRHLTYPYAVTEHAQSLHDLNSATIQVPDLSSTATQDPHLNSATTQDHKHTSTLQQQKILM